MYDRMEELNYSRDRRVTATRIHPPNPNSGLPFDWVVCNLCTGNGNVVNPSIDASGISAEQFHEDPDFYDDYMSGCFDIVCPQCGGDRVVAVLRPINGYEFRGVNEGCVYFVDEMYTGHWYRFNYFNFGTKKESTLIRAAVLELNKGAQPQRIDNPNTIDELEDMF